jgi:hypothetical protein
MIPHLVYYQLVIIILLWLCVMLPHLWPSSPGGGPKTPTPPIKPKRREHAKPGAMPLSPTPQPAGRDTIL